MIEVYLVQDDKNVVLACFKHIYEAEEFCNKLTNEWQIISEISQMSAYCVRKRTVFDGQFMKSPIHLGYNQ